MESKHPAGPATRRKASFTEAGKMALLLNRVLYSADTVDVPLSDGKTVVKRFDCEVQVFRNNDLLPQGVSGVGGNSAYFETEQLLMVIRDYLEYKALEEVIP